MQELPQKTLSEACGLLVRIQETWVRKGPKKRISYEYEYEIGAKVLSSALDTKLLTLGKAELIPTPQYCHPCLQKTRHIYYLLGDNVKCLTCYNELGENDTRPFAEVIKFEDKKHNKNS